MQNLQITFEVLLNKGPKAGQTIEVVTDLETLEEENLSDILVDDGILDEWCNQDEYTVTSRLIKLS
jgi:hypothetical protein